MAGTSFDDDEFDDLYDDEFDEGDEDDDFDEDYDEDDEYGVDDSENEYDDDAIADGMEDDTGEDDGYGEDIGDGYGVDDTQGQQTKAKRKKKNDNAQDENKEGEVNFPIRGKSKFTLNVNQMHKDAKRFGCLMRTQMKCPKCHQQSIWTEPVAPSLFRGMVWGVIGLQRTQRYVCLNAKCKAFYGKHKSRFKVNATGRLQYTHIPTGVDANPFHIDM